MRTNDYLINRSHRHDNYYLKMTKTRTVTFIIMIISTCALIISLTDAYPTTEVNIGSNVTEETLHSNNKSHLVITNIVKTIEFEVALMEDDGTNADSENTTEVSTPEYIETDIKLLNVNLLRELVNKATEEDTTTTSPDEETSTARGEGIAD